MKTALFILLLVFVFFCTSNGQSNYDLPVEAVVIETQPVTINRSLVLWMLNPEKFPREETDDIYTCPEYTRGSFYRGKTRVSLVDSKTRKVINTVEISEENAKDGSFDVPFLIQRFYYRVPAINQRKEGKPQILALQDYNGDGKAYEFAMYEALACMGLNTTLFGYSENQDKVIQYPTELTTNGRTETLFWVDYLFSKKPVRNGYWRYEIDYRGRAGSLDRYEIRYDKTKEMFVGILTSTTAEND